MLDQMTPEQFREQQAYYLIHPWGDDWMQTGTIAAAVHNAVTRYAVSKSGKDIQPSMWQQAFDAVPLPKWLRTKFEKSVRDNLAKKAKWP